MGFCILLATIIMLFLDTAKGRNADNLMKEIIKARTEYLGAAEAVVIEVNKKKFLRSLAYYYHIFQYEVDGKPYGENELIFSTGGILFPVGTKVRVRYDRNNPGSFMPVDDEDLYQMAKTEQDICIFMMIAGCVLCAIALLYLGASPGHIENW